jgi:hypothetical protein
VQREGIFMEKSDVIPAAYASMLGSMANWNGDAF